MMTSAFLYFQFHFVFTFAETGIALLKSYVEWICGGIGLIAKLVFSKDK